MAIRHLIVTAFSWDCNGMHSLLAFLILSSFETLLSSLILLRDRSYISSAHESMLLLSCKNFFENFIRLSLFKLDYLLGEYMSVSDLSMKLDYLKSLSILSWRALELVLLNELLKALLSLKESLMLLNLWGLYRLKVCSFF